MSQTKKILNACRTLASGYFVRERIGIRTNGRQFYSSFGFTVAWSRSTGTRNPVVELLDPINRFMGIKNLLTQWIQRSRRYKKRKWVAILALLDRAIKLEH